MRFFRTQVPFLFALFAAILLTVGSARADDWTLTGSGIRVKTVAFTPTPQGEQGHGDRGERGIFEERAKA